MTYWKVYFDNPNDKFLAFCRGLFWQFGDGHSYGLGNGTGLGVGYGKCTGDGLGEGYDDLNEGCGDGYSEKVWR